MSEKLNFKDLGLSKKVLEAISKKGFEEPSPIQVATIPVMLKNNTDIIAQAQTGTGKTAAFALPLVEMINPSKNNVQALILAPTRELAIQVSEEINSLKGSSGIEVVPIYGGQSIVQQLRRLKKGVHIVVGTPGRVIDHIKRRTLKLQTIKHLILDEADEMLNMGFIDDMEEIMKHTNQQKKTLLFSATMPAKIKNLAKKYMQNPQFISVKKQELTTNLTEQIYYEVRASDKFETLCRIVDIEDDFYGLVFCKTKNDVNNVVSHLNDRGYDADAIHGDISQEQRERTLRKFKNKKINILVATDVAARGIDVNNLTHVINYALPHDPEAYVHRIGRTGRAGNQGTAINFITPSEYKKLMFIQRVSKSKITKSKVPDIQEIINAKKKKINTDIASIKNEDVDDAYYAWAKDLLKINNPNQILGNLLSYCFNEELDQSLYTEIEDLSVRKNQNRKNDLKGKARLFVARGKKDKMTPAKLVKFIMQNAKVKNSVINQVEVYNDFSFLTVPFKEAETILHVFQKKSRGRPLVVKARKK